MTPPDADDGVGWQAHAAAAAAEMAAKAKPSGSLGLIEDWGVQ
jgi:hypothetical protein